MGNISGRVIAVFGLIMLVGGVLIGLVAFPSVLGHNAYDYRIQVMQDGDDIRFRYQTQTSTGSWKSVKSYRASDVREGVWYYGRAQAPDYQPEARSQSGRAPDASPEITHSHCQRVRNDGQCDRRFRPIRCPTHTHDSLVGHRDDHC